MQSVSIGKHRLSGQLFRAETDPRGSVLCIHGWQSRQSRWYEDATLLQAEGYTSLTFDMRGHDTTPGDLAILTQKDFLDDCVAVYDFLVALHPDQEVIVMGSNYGFYTEQGYDFETITTHCDDFVVLHSRDDKWVPFSAGEKIAEGLSACFLQFESRGHFGTGVESIPELCAEVQGVQKVR